MILSSIFSSSSSVASLFPALSFESTCFAGMKSIFIYMLFHDYDWMFIHWLSAAVINGEILLLPMSSAGLLGRLLMNVSKASFMALTNFSFFMKQMSMMWSTLSLKSSNSCTIVLSFSGLITIVLPKAWPWIIKDNGRQLPTEYGEQLVHHLQTFITVHTFMYSIQCCRRTWTPPRTRLKSW